MTRRGRPGKGIAHVDAIEASRESKTRLAVILETLQGSLSVEAACAELGLSRTRFAELRKRALQGAATELEPGEPGRPRKPPPEDAETAWRVRCEALERELDVSRLREALAQEDATPQDRSGEKGGAGARVERRKRRKMQRRSRRQSQRTR